MRLMDADGSYTLNASDNTGYSLCFGGGIISVVDHRGNVACEFFSEDAPTIDAAPVTHAYWIHDKKKRQFTCSNCGRGLNVADEAQVVMARAAEQFCYSCGAKMDASPDIAERCVACGDTIPEGRQVCPACEKEVDSDA